MDISLHTIINHIYTHTHSFAVHLLVRLVPTRLLHGRRNRRLSTRRRVDRTENFPQRVRSLRRAGQTHHVRDVIACMNSCLHVNAFACGFQQQGDVLQPHRESQRNVFPRRRRHRAGGDSGLGQPDSPRQGLHLGECACILR